jgi:hypothetical protein
MAKVKTPRVIIPEGASAVRCMIGGPRPQLSANWQRKTLFQMVALWTLKTDSSDGRWSDRLLRQWGDLILRLVHRRLTVGAIFHLVLHWLGCRFDNPNSKMRPWHTERFTGKRLPHSARDTWTGRTALDLLHGDSQYKDSPGSPQSLRATKADRSTVPVHDLL